MNDKTRALIAALILFSMSSVALAQQPAYTTINVKKMHCAGCAKKIAARLYTVRGVKEVRVNMQKKAFFVMPQTSAVLSPRAMWEAVEKAEDNPIRLAGPSGVFTAKPRF